MVDIQIEVSTNFKIQSVAVVITTSKVSQETRQYAESLNVEIITKDEIHLIQQAMNGQSIEYLISIIF